MPSVKYPSSKITVVIRDDSPMIHCNDSPTYRSVQIELTKEQVDRLALQATIQSGGTFHYEEISKCFIEPAEATQ